MVVLQTLEVKGTSLLVAALLIGMLETTIRQTRTMRASLIQLTYVLASVHVPVRESPLEKLSGPNVDSA